MTNIYKKFLLALILPCLFIGACSKKENTGPTPGENTPTITSLSITSGEANATVIITGTNFSTNAAHNQVQFNGKTAVVDAATATQLTVKVPKDAGSGAVTVSVNNGTLATGPLFTYITTPIVTSIDVNKGTDGTIVKITGAGFSPTLTDNNVFFNGKRATVLNATTTVLTVSVPVGAGTGVITVSVATSSLTTGPNFTYSDPLKIIASDINKGVANDIVNITGAGFSSVLTENKVFFNGTAATVVSATATQISVKVPVDCGIGKITISLGGQSVEGPTFDYYIASTVSTFVGQPNNSGYSEGTGATAKFGTLMGIVADASHTLYVSDNTNGRIRKISVDGTVSTFVGDGTAAGNVLSPTSLTNTRDGDLFFAEASGMIKNVEKDGAMLNYAGNSNAQFIAKPPFSQTLSLSVSSIAGICIADKYNGLVRRIGLNGIVTMAGSSVGASVDGDGIAARFGEVNAVTDDNFGNIYVLDGNGSIRKIQELGRVTTVLSQKSITNIYADRFGRVYFTDGSQLKVMTGSGKVSIIAGSSDKSNVIADGNQYTARFANINSITVDNADRIYVTDNNCIRKIIIN